MAGLMRALGLPIPAWRLARFLTVRIGDRPGGSGSRARQELRVRGEDAKGVPSLFLSAVQVRPAMLFPWATAETPFGDIEAQGRRKCKDGGCGGEWRGGIRFHGRLFGKQRPAPSPSRVPRVLQRASDFFQGCNRSISNGSLPNSSGIIELFQIKIHQTTTELRYALDLDFSTREWTIEKL